MLQENMMMIFAWLEGKGIRGDRDISICLRSNVEIALGFLLCVDRGGHQMFVPRICTGMRDDV